MQFRCRIPAGWRFFVPLCNTQHGAYESDSSLHRRLFTDGNFEKNRRGGCAGSGPARRELQCNGKYGGRSGRWYKCRRRQRGKGVHDNRPDACGGKTARAAGRCRGGIRRAGIRGRVAPAALERLQEIRGEGTPAVVLAVYGNRAFGTAVAQLAAFVAERGFVPVAAGAFVGEHSYSTPGTPIAEGRPDTQDLAEAAAFGARIGQKLAHGETGPIDAAKLREPHTPLLSKLRFIRFVLGYRRRQKRNPVALLPAGDAARCTQCGRCVALCPTQAIARGDELHTDPARCIRCCACVKGCAFGARTFETPFAAVLSRNFARRKPPVTLM